MDRRALEHIDRPLLAVVLLINVIGWFNLYSASAMPGSAEGEVVRAGYWYMQIVWFFLGLAPAAALALFIDYRLLERIGNFFFALVIFLLLIVLIKGKIAGGSQRWINLYVFNLQPSMLAQLAIVLFSANWFQNHYNPMGHRIRDLIAPAAIMGVPAILILAQPDLGTSGLLGLIAASIFITVRIKRRSLAIMAALAFAALAPAWAFVLKPYQKRRILTFLNPESDALGSGYHVIQSKIAIGSGGWWGEGWTKGSQAKLNFLPERHTDFAFAVFAEENGFVFCALLLCAYIFLIWRGLEIAQHSRDRYGAILAVGCTAILFWPVVINIAMVIGMFPVVGIPLPFFSYGGSSMIVNMICVGLLTNISMRRYMF